MNVAAKAAIIPIETCDQRTDVKRAGARILVYVDKGPVGFLPPELNWDKMEFAGLALNPGDGGREN